MIEKTEIHLLTGLIRMNHELWGPRLENISIDLIRLVCKAFRDIITANP